MKVRMNNAKRRARVGCHCHRLFIIMHRTSSIARIDPDASGVSLVLFFKIHYNNKEHANVNQ
jgi:hypothetical protein